MELKFMLYDKAKGVLVMGTPTKLIDTSDGQVLDTKKDDYVDWTPYLFTGLLEKNGKEIYKGHICRVEKTLFVAEIIYENGAFWLGEDIPLWELIIDKNGNCIEIEIIGHITDKKQP